MIMSSAPRRTAPSVYSTDRFRDVQAHLAQRANRIGTTRTGSRQPAADQALWILTVKRPQVTLCPSSMRGFTLCPEQWRYPKIC